jgi:hypothetical protein
MLCSVCGGIWGLGAYIHDPCRCLACGPCHEARGADSHQSACRLITARALAMGDILPGRESHEIGDAAAAQQWGVLASADIAILPRREWVGALRQVQETRLRQSEIRQDASLCTEADMMWLAMLRKTKPAAPAPVVLNVLAAGLQVPVHFARCPPPSQNIVSKNPGNESAFMRADNASIDQVLYDNGMNDWVGECAQQETCAESLVIGDETRENIVDRLERDSRPLTVGEKTLLHAALDWRLLHVVFDDVCRGTRDLHGAGMTAGVPPTCLVQRKQAVTDAITQMCLDRGMHNTSVVHAVLRAVDLQTEQQSQDIADDVQDAAETDTSGSESQREGWAPIPMLQSGLASLARARAEADADARQADDDVHAPQAARGAGALQQPRARQQPGAAAVAGADADAKQAADPATAAGGGGGASTASAGGAGAAAGAAPATEPTAAAIQETIDAIGSVCWEHIVVWKLLDKSAAVRATFGVTLLPKANGMNTAVRDTAQCAAGKKCAHLSAIGLKVCRVACSTLACNPIEPRTGAQVAPHRRHIDKDADATQERLDDILRAIEAEALGRGDTVRSLAHIISEAGYAQHIDKLPSFVHCNLKHMEQLYSDCGVPKHILDHLIFRDEWSDERWAQTSKSSRRTKIARPFKGLIVMLAGNRCSICGTKLLKVGS